MSEIKEKREKHLSDYLFVLFKWKKFVIINSVIVIVLSVVYSLSIPMTYKATATMMIPPEKEMGLGSILSGGNSAFSFGAKLLGGGTPSSDMILGLMNSRTIIEKVIDKFNLFLDYEVEERNYDKVIKKFKGDLIFTPNEYGLIEVHVINKSPQLSADIANYFVYLADSLNIILNTENSKNNRGFVEKRFIKTKIDLEFAENNYYKFQKKFGVFDIPEQIKVSVNAASELEAKIIEKEILLYSIKSKISEEAPQYQDLLIQIKVMKAKLKGFYSNHEHESFFIPFDQIPDLQIEYLRLYRELEIQNKILEFIYPMYEQAKIDEQKSIPTLLIVDKANPPQLKHAPKKALVVIVVYSLFLFMTFIFIFRANDVLMEFVYSNPLVEKEKKIYGKIAKLFRIKINE